MPAAIHVSPECVLGGPLAHVRTGDMIRLDTQAGLLQALVDETEWASRTSDVADLSANVEDMGREFFAGFRQHVSTAETGAVSVFGD